MNINYIDRETNPLQVIWYGIELQGREPIQADREALREMDNGREWMIIRYVAMELLSGGDYTRDEIEEGAAVCDDRLYLNDFNGYYLDDANRLDCLYFNVNNRICATVHNVDSDVDTYWIVY